MMHTAAVSPAKKEEVKRIKKLAEEHKVIGVANLEKVPAKALHGLRDQLRGDVVITMSKKKLIEIAFKELDKTQLTEFAESMSGVSALLFTDMNPIKLAQFLESKAVKGPAKGGDIAPIDIEVKAGDTKIAPGPIISELNQHLKAPTMIKNGTIHIRNDTVTHKVGDLISDKQAQLLTRLGVEPMTIKLDFYSAWEDGEIIPTEVLHLNVDDLLNNVRLGASQGMNLAIGLNMITDETVDHFVTKAIRESMGIALELPIFIPDLLNNYLAKATAQATVLNAAALGLELPSAPSAPQTESSSEPEPEEEEEETTGLGGLFD